MGIYYFTGYEIYDYLPHFYLFSYATMAMLQSDVDRGNGGVLSCFMMSW